MVGNPNAPSQSPQEDREYSQPLKDVQEQLRALQQSIESSQETDPEKQKESIQQSIDAMADVLQKAVDAGVDPDDIVAIANRTIELEDKNFEAATEAKIKVAVELHGQLDGLTREVSATTGVPAPETKSGMVSMIAGGLNTGVDYAKQYVNQMEDGVVKNILQRILSNMSSTIVVAVEKMAGSFIGQFIIDDSEILNIGSMRLALQEKTLDALPELKKVYNAKKAQCREKWLTEYKKWFQNGQSGAIPSLESIVQGFSGETAPAAPESQQPATPDVFASDEISKPVEAGKEYVVTLAGDKRLRVQKGKIVAQFASGTKTVELMTGSTNVQIESIARSTADVANPSEFRLVLGAGAGEVAMQDLATAIDTVADEPVQITGTSVSVTKTA